ncbi:DUF6387 family protein [Serratia marcescens]|uniref:DUF6387 family protein n=1 Tax=Serratia marcescens TaxID=615 RepID=UPI0037D1728F
MKTQLIVDKLNDWFSLNNYDDLQYLTIEQLRMELVNRSFMNNQHWFVEDGINDDRIFSGKPLTTTPIPREDIEAIEVVSEESKNRVTEFTLSSDDHIHTLWFGRLAMMDYSARKKLAYRYNNDGNIEFKNELMFASVSNNLDEGNRTSVCLEIDLSDSTDEELVYSFMHLLTKWRKELNVKEPSIDNLRFGVGTIKKLIEYRIIPLLDIIYWEKQNDLKIPNELLSRILFPLDKGVIKSGAQIKDTAKPLAIKTLTTDFDRYFGLFLKKNGHLRGMRISDVMKLAD